MAKVNMKHFGNIGYQKRVSVSSAYLSKSEFSGTDEIMLFKLPNKSLIKSIYVGAEVATNAGITVDVKFDNDVVANDKAVDAVALTKTDLDKVQIMPTEVTITPSAEITKGTVLLIIEYIEYTVATGFLTN